MKRGRNVLKDAVLYMDEYSQRNSGGVDGRDWVWFDYDEREHEDKQNSLHPRPICQSFILFVRIDKNCSCLFCFWFSRKTPIESKY